jgi:hypothetical protein
VARRSVGGVRFRRVQRRQARHHLCMFRAPKTADLFHAPPEFLCDHGSAVALPLGGRVKATTLRAFVRAMAAQGTQVQAARLGYDRLYACECFASAHTSDDARLRSLALELFHAFERRRA